MNEDLVDSLLDVFETEAGIEQKLLKVGYYPFSNLELRHFLSEGKTVGLGRGH